MKKHPIFSDNWQEKDAHANANRQSARAFEKMIGKDSRVAESALRRGQFLAVALGEHMSISQRKFFIPVLLAILVVGTLAVVVARSGSNRNRSPSPQVSSPALLQTQTKSAISGNGPRNLSRQPEAFKMGRLLGSRFAPAKREESILTGALTIGSDRRIVQTTRTQTEDGERVEIGIDGSTASLSWNAAQGGLSSSSGATGGDRELIERLVLDSPDQFVLAQLRGASYYTVARNVRPDDAKDGYAGPLWNIVQLHDPQTDQEKQPLSEWRLYYLNTTTGLIDRIVREPQGQRIIAELIWTESNGEKVPAQITWTSQGQIIMQYSLTSFSHADQLGAR
jgi:hypothetical protein